MQTERIKQMIESGLPGAQAQVRGDGTHFEAVVVCSAFAGQPLLKQHRMVYATLGDAMQAAVHALSIKTYTPETWAAAQSETTHG